jgi:hypothetical protein
MIMKVLILLTVTLFLITPAYSEERIAYGQITWRPAPGIIPADYTGWRWSTFYIGQSLDEVSGWLDKAGIPPRFLKIQRLHGGKILDVQFPKACQMMVGVYLHSDQVNLDFVQTKDGAWRLAAMAGSMVDDYTANPCPAPPSILNTIEQTLVQKAGFTNWADNRPHAFQKTLGDTSEIYSRLGESQTGSVIMIGITVRNDSQSELGRVYTEALRDE